MAGPSLARLCHATSITLQLSFTFPFVYSWRVALLRRPGRVPVSRENLVNRKSCTRRNSLRVASLCLDQYTYCLVVGLACLDLGQLLQGEKSFRLVHHPLIFYSVTSVGLLVHCCPPALQVILHCLKLNDVVGMKRWSTAVESGVCGEMEELLIYVR